MNIWSSITPPPSQDVQLKYNESFSISSLTGFTQIYYRANDWFDMNPAIGGHQPAFYDDWSNFYTFFQPVGASLTVTASNTSTTNAALLSLLPLIGSGVPTNGEAVLEYPKVVTHQLEPLGSNASTTLTLSYPFRKWYSANGNYSQPVEFLLGSRAPVTSNFPYPLTFDIAYQNLTGLTGTASAQITVCIVVTGRFSGLKAQSAPSVMKQTAHTSSSTDVKRRG